MVLDKKELEKPIVFVDSHCVVCNGLVEWIIARDKKKNFRFAGLNSDIFDTIKQNHQISNIPDTVVLYEKGLFSFKSSAVLRIFQLLGPPWSLLQATAKYIPKNWRDNCYDWVARHRYGWFGQMEEDYCRMPDPDHRDRFLG